MGAANRPEKGKLEAELRQLGHFIVGIDEVGRGCWAGPVCAGAAILDYEKLSQLTDKERGLIRDSKLLSCGQRQAIVPIIHSIALATQVGWSSVREIETLGLQRAIYLAMERAVSQLTTAPTFALVDGTITIPGIRIPQRSVVKGDQLCFAIAAAAILAKEARDDYMRDMEAAYPDFGFGSHVGYGTKTHSDAIARNGICELHRRNFAPIAKALQLGASRLPHAESLDDWARI